MPNFTATMRLSYADIEGLVLDCRHDGLAADGSLWTNVAPPRRTLHTGSHDGANNAAVLVDTSQNWFTDQLVGSTAYNTTDGSMGTVTANTSNSVTATLAGGAENDWDTGDTYRITSPRFGNPYQSTIANRPSVSTPGAYSQAQFLQASSQFFNIPLDDTIAAGRWFIAFEYLAQGATGTSLPVVYFPNVSIWRQNGAGNFKYRHGGTDVNGAGDMSAGTWALAWTGAATATLYKNDVSQLAGSASNQSIVSGDPAGYIGYDGAGNYCDIILRSVQIWRRQPAPMELDFAYQTLSAEFSYNSDLRCTMGTDAWTDDTGTTGQEISRINPIPQVQQLFYTANFAAGTVRRVQISAAINGLVVPDTDLGGDLFDLVPIEYPVGAPAIYKDTGWSALWDVAIRDEGHYTFLVYRQNGGRVVLHLDAIEV